MPGATSSYTIQMIDKITSPARTALGAVSGLQGAMGGLGDATKALDAVFPGLSEAMGVTAGAAIGLGVAVIGLTGAGAALAISSSNFKNDSIDALEAFTDSRDAAAATYAHLQDIADLTQLTDAQVQTKALDLLGAGIKQGAQLDATIKSVADLQAVLGAQGASKLQSIIERATTSGKFQIDARKLVGTGVQMSDLYAELAGRLHVGVDQVKAQLKAGTIAADVGIDAMNAVIDKKFGGAAARKMLDLDVQGAKLKDNISRIFADVKVEGFLSALKDVGALFDQNTASGKALKAIASGIFDPLFDAAKAALPYVKQGLEELIIVSLRLYIALKPSIAAVEALINSGNANTSEAKIMRIGDAASRGIAPIVAMAETLIRLYVILDRINGAISGLVGGALGSGSHVASAKASGANVGQAFTAGMVGGIGAGAGDVHAAAAGLGAAASGGVVKKLLIASPSKVMHEHGQNTAAGFAGGLAAGSGDAEDAMASMVSPPPPAAAGRAAGGGKGATVVNVGGIQITIGGSGSGKGGEDHKALADELTAKLAAFFEQLSLEGGG